MKDFIVMIAIIILGITIGGIVLTFKSKATDIGTTGSNALDAFKGTLTP